MTAALKQNVAEVVKSTKTKEDLMADVNSLRQMFDTRKDLGITITKSSSAFKLDPRMLVRDPGFNSRKYDTPANKDHIENLYRAILRGEDLGLFKVFVKNGVALLRDGYCRSYAIEKALDTGLEVPPVTVEEISKELEAKGGHEVILTTNNGKKLEPLERGRTYKVMLDSGHYTIQQIADIEGCSAVAVRNLIKAFELPQEVKVHIEQGHISYTQALNLQKQYRDTLSSEIDTMLSRADSVLEEAQPSSIKSNDSTIPDMSGKGKLESVPDDAPGWDIMATMVDNSASSAVQKTKKEPATREVPATNNKKNKLTARNFGAKTIKGDQSTRVIKLVERFENLIREAATDIDCDPDSVSIKVDRELAEEVLALAHKLSSIR